MRSRWTPAHRCFARRLELAVLPAGRIMATATGLEVDLPALIRQNLDRDVFIIGEYHDSYACHAWQRDFIEALAKRVSAPAGGLRIFQPRRRPFPGPLPERQDRRSGAAAENRLVPARRPEFRLHAPGSGTVKKLGLKAVGPNVPRELVSRVAKGGLAKLSAAERAMFPGAGRTYRTLEHSSCAAHWASRRAGAALVPQRLCRPEVLGHGHGRIHAPGPGAPEFRGRKGIIIASSARVGLRRKAFLAPTAW